MSYYGRSSLTRILLEKESYDQMFTEMDKSVWYRVDHSKIGAEMCAKFVPLSLDSETSAFLDYCLEISNSVCLQMFYNVASYVLKMFMSKTCINGFLNRGLMFLFSTEHLTKLLPPPIEYSTNFTDGFNQRVALDLGAGDGTITEKLFHLFAVVYATETSMMMKRRLTEKHFNVLPTLDEWESAHYRFDTIFALNLIDRHPKPLTLLNALHKKLVANETSNVVLAVVFPWHQFVEYPDKKADGSNPVETIKLDGKSFEEQVQSFVDKILTPIGFVVERWSRLPYLCEGDLYKTCYWLDDAVFILKHNNR